MSLTSPLLIVCFGQDGVRALSELATSLGYPDAHTVEGGFAAAAEALAQRPSPPDYIILDIDGHGEEILAELDHFAQHCEPTVRVVALGTINDINFYRELKARGVLEYLPHPVSASAVRAVLLQSATHYTAQTASSGACTVISFMSAASADGATTLALNTAYALAEEYNQPVVLIDMDYQFGLISKSLDLAAPFGIRELFDYPERGLDNVLINKMLVKYKDKLSIIAAPNELRLQPKIRPEIIRELISVLRTQFRFIVVDVPHVWTDWNAAMLSYSDHVVMVAQLWLRSLTHATRLLSAWQSVGIAQGDVSLVVNRSGAKFKEGVTVKDFERICRHPINGFINNDVKTVTQAENHAQTIMESAAGGLLPQQIRQLARDLGVRFQAGTSVEAARPFSGGDKRKLLTMFNKKTEG